MNAMSANNFHGGTKASRVLDAAGAGGRTEPPILAAASFPAPFGSVRVALGERGVTAVGLDLAPPADRDALLSWAAGLNSAAGARVECGAHPLLDELERAFADYFERRRALPPLPLDLDQGTRFQQDVWWALCAIPHGETRSYRQIAAAVGRPRAARAVGRACGRNPLPILVPCHRVITTAGTLGGFGSGLEVKRRLLELERAAPPAA